MAKISEVSIGSRYGKLVVKGLVRLPCRNIHRLKRSPNCTELCALCDCDCGLRKTLPVERLGKLTNSCGCLHNETITTHGLSRPHSRLYQIWHAMVKRCTNRGHRTYRYYGAKGVAVCGEWLDDFPAFLLWAQSNGYANNLSIDRVDPAGNYEPNNCRWVLPAEQAGNRRNRQMYAAWGETKSVAEWLKDDRCVLKNRRVIRQRVFTLKWTPEEAMSAPVP